jgi:ABC-type transport system substrate-binding protein
MKKHYLLAITLLMVLLTMLVPPNFQAKATKGPRSDVDVQFYGSHEEAYAALVAGDIDFIQGSLTYEQRMACEADPNLCVSDIIENEMMQFDLNNNYTIQTYPGVRNPLHLKEFRRALSCMVDKQYIIDEILEGAGALLNVPISLNSISWWPTCALPANFEWTYNLTKAEEQLQLANFVDTDADTIRNYPSGWPGVTPDGKNMDPLIFYVRTEDKRLDVGRYLASQLDYFGVPYDKIEGSSDVCYPPVMTDLNYHLYTGGWSVGRYPTNLHYLYHSDYFYSDGPNYVTGMNQNNLPNYPELDNLLSNVYYTESIASSQVACKLAAALGWCDLVVNIPLWNPDSFVAWRKTMAGVINMDGYGLDNRYQFLNAYNTVGSSIKMGTIAAPKALNPMYSQWCYDYAVLDRVYDSLLYYNPYDLGIDQPWAAYDWEVSTWIDPDPGPSEPSVKQTVTYCLRKDVGVIAPNGTFMRYLNAYDLDFSCWYTYAFDDGWNWADYQDVHHTEVINDYIIKYYFDDASYWFYTAPQYPIFMKPELIDTLCTDSCCTIDGPLPADTFVKLANGNEQIIQVINDTLGINYEICGGYEDYEHNWIWLLDPLPAGTYEICYYTPSADPHGYYLAGLDWTETWYGFGPFYPIGITPGVGGSVSFNKNPYFWLGESPPVLGETDWRWVWDTPGHIPGWENPGRDSGYFEISIYDVVKATSCYGHIGYATYDPVYFPGADLDANDLGTVGIYDIVTITGKYGLQWNIPPA